MTAWSKSLLLCHDYCTHDLSDLTDCKSMMVGRENKHLYKNDDNSNGNNYNKNNNFLINTAMTRVTITMTATTTTSTMTTT